MEKKKQAEIRLPEEVILFLRCISPSEFVKLDGKECHQREIIVYFQNSFETHQSEKILLTMKTSMNLVIRPPDSYMK